MRPPFNLRAGHAVPALGALAITTTLVSTGPLAAHAASGPDAADPASAGEQALDASLLHTHIGYRQPLVVTGRLASGEPGQLVALQYELRGATSWQTVATATTEPAGGYRLTAPLDRSGMVRVMRAPGATLSSVAATPLATSATTTADAGQLVYVGAAIASHTAQRDVLSGHRVTVRGSVRPLAQDAPVVLQARRAHRWLTLARTRTGRSGRYTLRFTPRQTGSVLVRVRFGGNAVNDATAHRVGVINVYRLAGASWYELLGSPLACGGALTSGTLGVANKTLPCGTMVTLHYGNRTVRVPVVDRGPYVAGRDYDLTPATKAQLGFGDTGTLWATA
jgi:hypothetical protein